MSLAHRLGQVLRLRQRDAVLGRDDHRRGEAGEREVGGGEALAGQVRTAVGQERGDRVELGQDLGAVVVEALELELRAGPSGAPASRGAVSALASQAGTPWLLYGEHQLGAREHVRVDQAPAVRAEPVVEPA